ncbi:MAG: hypothetical protein EA425_04740 [Puniceicoccaceae bacterium]|nr:MAG: hypothetical protein EA425_04740 [Puniceicoccaceae bacterium]
MNRSITALVWGLLGLPLAGFSAPLTLVGSDLFSPALDKALTVFAEENGLDLKVDLAGTHPARRALERGEARVAVLAAPADFEPPMGDWRILPFAYHAVVFSVARTNPLEQADLPRLRSIFSQEDGADIRRWGDLGLAGEWAARSISPQVLSSQTSLVVNLFRQLAGRPGSELRAVVVVHQSPASLHQRLSGDPSAIGLLPKAPPEAAGQKVLAVSERPGDIAFGPTLENIHAGDYPLRMPFVLVFRNQDAAELRPLLSFLLSDAGAAAIEAAGLHPLPPAARRLPAGL